MCKERFNLFFLLFFLSGMLAAQHYSTSFGQNRIQYKNFEWFYYSTNNFDIYYYPGGEEYALEAVEYLEDEFVELTDKLGYAPYNKTKIFIYNSINDLQQSNVGIDGDVFTIGGRTEFVKLNLEVAYPGQAVQFKDQLIYELSSTLVNDMMYGGSLADIFQNSYLLSLPSWFIDGAARYIAYGWSREMDDYLRDYMSRKKIRKLSRIDGEAAATVGQSIWNYLAVKYGEGNISNILNLTRIIRKEENAIANTLGVSFKVFLEEWETYYQSQREEVQENYVKVGKDKIIDKIRRVENLITTSITFNNDAERVAYATQKNGKYKIYSINLLNGKKKLVNTGGFQISGQELDTQLPLLDWQDAFTLGAIIYKRGYLYLNTFNIETGEIREKPLTRFKQIESFAFNDNGRLAIISGDIGGQNDLFLIAMNRNSVRRITRDIYDDLDPTFVPGTAAIIFSSNRKSDSVKVSNIELESLDDNFNLFVYDLDTTTTSFYRVTNMLSEDRKPYARSTQDIYYLSDQRGISNLYRYSFSDSVTTQITNFDKSIISYDLHFDPERITYSMLDRGEEKVFLDTTLNLNTSKFTIETPRRRREQAQLIINRNLENAIDTIPEPTREVDLSDTEDFNFEEDIEVDTVEFDDPNWIDTDNYVFEDDAETSFQSESFFSKYQSFEQENERIGPISYEPIFSFKNVITSFLWDPYRDFMMLLETEINDVLENYKIKAGALVTTNFEQGDVFTEFQYLKYWMDLKVRLDRKTYLLDDSDPTFLQRYQLNRLKISAAVPITHTFRLEAAPFFTNTSFNNLNFQSVSGQNQELAENDTDEYLGGTFSMVFDNTIERSFNLYQGTRALFEVTQHLHVENTQQNFGSMKLDVRHYQKLHKEITWATRLLYGKQFGADPKTYMLGGMDNWLFANRNRSGEGNPLRFSNETNNSDLLFNEFITNLRGLDYSEAYGTDALVINTELRVPVFQYLINGPIKSNFLRNFQLTSFADLGSVWTGKPPFRDGRSITRSFSSPGFDAEIVQFRNPWLGGFGYGLRTVFLGYYVKVDAARSYIDGVVGNYRFYVTLGIDF